jgi:hypothetical protein
MNAMRKFRFEHLLHLFPLIFPVCVSSALCAQPEAFAHHEIYGGYSLLSNSFNGVPGSRRPLNGWDASFGFAPWRGLRFKVEAFGYRGTNLGAPQQPLFILGGGQYSRRVRRETIFVEGMAGEVGLNRNWGANQTLGETASFATLLGGGLDTPLSRRFACRVNAGFVYENIALQGPKPLINPYRIPGLPNYFGRISTGLVWRF